MKKLVLASLMAVTVGSFAAMAEELSGYISDSHCGAKHNTVSEANTKCIQSCLKNGEPVLVVGDKVMKFDADSAAKAKDFAGQNVKIMGSLEGDAVKITSIEKAAQ
jgi:phage tail tape-measure protein